MWYLPLLMQGAKMLGDKISGDKDRKAARDLQNKQLQTSKDAANVIGGVQDPRLEDIAMEQYATPDKFSADTGYDPALMEAIGYSPERIQAAQLGPSAFESIKTDQAARADQQKSLAALQDLAARGGRSIVDEANLNRLQGQNASMARGNRDAAISAMRGQGKLTGGNELMARLQSNQDADMRNSQASLDAAGSAQARALQAILQAGQLSGQMSDRDYGRQATAAQAKDAISQFNAQNQNIMAARNADAANAAAQFGANAQNQAGNINMAARNRAAETGLGNRRADAMTNYATGRDIANKNVDLRNQAMMYNKTAKPMTAANFQMQRAQGQANAMQGLANNYSQVSNQRAMTGAAKDDALMKIGSKLAEKAWDSYSNDSPAKKEQDAWWDR